MITKISPILIILALFAFAHADLIQPVTRTPVRPFSINQGYVTDYSFSIYIPSTISVNAYIEVEFPQPYQLPSECKAYIKIGTGSYTFYSCSKPSYSKYLISMGSISPDEYTIVFVGIKNPTTHPASSNFKIKTYLNQIILVDSNEFFDSVPFLPASGTSKNCTIKNIGYASVSLGSSYDFTFGLKKALSKGDSIKFNFPEGFFFLKPACFHRNSGTYAQTETLYNNRSVICQAFQDSMATGVFQVVSIIGVVNPEYAGVFKNFYLETLEGTSANVYERISIPNYIQISPGKVTLDIKSDSLLLSVNTTHQFEFMFENDIPADGQVWIKIPPGFRYLKANCTLLRPIEAQPDKEVTCELAANKTGYIIRGFTGISASQTITLNTIAENPPVATNYKIQVFSFSSTYNAMIDEAFGYINILNQYGASKVFASHSLRWTRRLKHNEPGPLEFTFFLNIPLPSTASTFYGKVIIDIRPQLTLPAAPKSLRCFFYNTIPAQSCTWDVTTNSDRTTVTMFTPITDPYFQTEIPITVTTEDSVGTYGILLPMLIQRYKFYFYFWRNGDSKEHEVYFEDYVPEPIELANSDVSLGVYPLQYNQEAYMELTWTNTYYGLGTNYFIEFEFDHSVAGWDYNLGFTALGYYDRYILPCLVVNSLNPTTNYKCYLNPGGSSSTNSTIQILYIGTIPMNTVMTVRLPKIKLGLSGAAEVRFTLYENTPGENTLKIPIVYKDFFFTPSTATGLSTSSSFSIALNSYQPDIDVTLTLSFTSTAQNPRYIIYEYPSLFTIATKTVSCSSNLCHIFTSNEVHWIVFAITNVQNYAASTALTIHTPPYISTNTYYARTEKSGPIEDWRTNAVTITAGVFTTMTFTTNSGNPEINKNSLLLFDITATTITNIPLDGSVVLTFTDLTVPDDDDFYCQIVSGLTGQTVAVGIVCEKMPGYTTKIRIYNFNAVSYGTGLSFRVNMWTSTVSTVNCKVETFYDRAASSNRLIDNGNRNLAMTFANDNFASSLLINDHSGDIVRVNTYAAITLSVTPTHTASQATITVTFGSGFTLSTTTDVPYCKLTRGANTERKRCTFTNTSPVTISIPLIDSTYITAGSPLTIYLTTDYSDPNIKGIRSPGTPGYQHMTVQITATSGSAFSETNGEFVYVYPAVTPGFKVTGTCTSADYYTMFNFVFTITQALNSNSHASTRGRIYLEFPVGTGGFRDDLGTDQPNGGTVGCRTVIGGTLYSAIKCRLVKSPGNSLPAAVELIGFGPISAGTTLTVTVARVKNVQTTVGENVFGLRIEHVDVATGTISPREYTTYNLWFRVYTISTPSNYTTAPTVTFQANPFPNFYNIEMYPYMYTATSLTYASSGPSTDYYIYELPLDFKLNDLVNCPSGISSSSCYSFPEIGWLVYEIAGGNTVSANTANSATLGRVQYVTVPGSFSYDGYVFTAYIWKNNILNHYMTHKILHTDLRTSSVGPLQALSITMDSDQLVKSRQQTEITVSFRTYSDLPSTGTIEIRFTSGVVPQGHCKSAPSMGSLLTSSTGRVACTIQVNSWLITNFDALAGGSNVRIYGFVNLPAPSTATNYYVTVYTYGTQHATDIANIGRPIDSYTSTGLVITVQPYNTLSLDGAPSTLINSPILAKASTYRPLIFDFTLNGLSITNGYVIEITVFTTGSNFYNSMASGGSRICSFMQISNSNYIACSVSASSSGSILVFTLYPQQTLNANTAYRGTITSVFAQNGQDGLQHPSAAGTYQVSILARQGSTEQRDIDFYEVVPDQFSNLIVKNYVISTADEDVIDVSLSSTSSIPASTRLVVELPTYFNSTILFANDLGLGLLDAQDKLCEKISSTPSGLTMSCFFQKGNYYAKTPATIVLYSFSAAFTAVRFAFTAKNPSVTSPTVIPLTIYTLNGASSVPPFIKTYYQTVERAITVLPSVSAVNNGNQPYYTPRTVKAISTALTTSSLTIQLSHNNNLETTDYYAIKIPQMGSPSTVYIDTLSTIIGGVWMNVIILPKNKWIILNPYNTAIGNGNWAAITSSTFYNPEQGLVGPAGLSFMGYAAHFSTMTCVKVTYTYNAADFTGLTSFPSGPTVTAFTNEILQNNVLIITVNAVYQGIKTVIIRIPTELTLREDCYEGYGNQIETYECKTDSTNRYVYVALEDKTYSTSALNLVLNVLVVNGNSAAAVSGFDYYLYTTVETDPSDLLGQRYAVTGASPSITLVAGSSVASPTFVEAEYVPYVENNVYYPVSTYGDLRFKFTMPIAVSAGYSFKLYLPSSVIVMDSSTSAGDLTSTPAVIMYHPTDITTTSKYVLVPATYSGGVLSFTTTYALTSGNTISFTVTSMKKTGELLGVGIASSYSNTESNVILEIYSGSTLLRTAQLGDLVLTQTQSYSVSLLPMTKAASEVTAWEFTISSMSSAIDSFYIDFPTVDDYGNALWDSNLGVFSKDSSIVPCASSRALSTQVTPECTFFMGTAAQPAKILVKNFQQSASSMVLYLGGMKNPAVSRRVYMNIRFYAGTSFHSLSRVLGYLTEPSNIPVADQNDDTNYFVYGSTYGVSRTYTFRTGSTIPNGGLVLVKLDAACTVGAITTNMFFLSGTIGNYAIRKLNVQVNAGGYYDIDNFRCSKALGLAFTQYNMAVSSSGSSNGERRLSRYNVDASTRQGYTSGSGSLALSSAKISTNMYNQAGVAKFDFDIDGLISYFTFNGNNLIPQGAVITITFSYYFSGISACKVYGGLVLNSPTSPVSCTYSGTTITISNFKNIVSGGLLKLQLSYTTAASYSGSGTAAFYLYGSSALNSASDFAYYGTVGLGTMNAAYASTTMLNPGAPSFTGPPYPGRNTGNVELYFNALTIPNTFTAGSADYLRIGIEKGILTASTGCSALDNTGYYISCSYGAGTDYDYLYIRLNPGWGFSSFYYTRISFSNTNWPVEARNIFYEFVYQSNGNVVWRSNSVTANIKGQNVAVADVDPLHRALNFANEIKYRISTPIALDTYKILSFTYSNINVQANHLSEIDCMCSADARCFNWNDGSTKSIDVVFTSGVAASTTLDCYIPNLLITGGTESPINQIIDVSSREIYFTTPAATPFTYYGSATGATHSCSFKYPYPNMYPYTNYDIDYRIYSPYNIQAGSLFYTDFGASGLIFPCIGYGISSCRYYNTIRNILVMTVGAYQPANNWLYFIYYSSATLTYSPRASDTAANLTLFNYVAYGDAVQSQFTFSLTPAYSTPYPQQTTITHTFDESRYGLLAVQKISFATMTNTIPLIYSGIGGRLELTVVGIIVASPYDNCYAAYSGRVLTCTLTYVSSTVTIVLTDTADIPASRTINVYFTGNNPTSGSTTITLKGYSYYHPSFPTYNVRILGGSATTSSYTANSGTYVPIGNAGMFSLMTKSISSANVPIRLKFKLTTALQAGLGKVTLNLPAGEYAYNTGANVLGYFRTYATDFDFTQAEASAISVTGTSASGLTIVVTTANNLAANTLYEVIIITDLVPLSSANFAKVTADQKTLTATFDNNGGVFAKEKIRIYKYQDIPFITMPAFYYTSKYASDVNVLVLSLYVNAAITTFSTSMIEIELPSASTTIIKSGVTTSTRQLTCGIVNLSKRSASGALTPKCILTHSTKPKIRIENYPAYSAGTTFNVILYDLLNGVIPQDTVLYFDAVVVYTDLNTQSRSKVKLTRAFTTLAGSASAPTTAMSTAVASNYNYATPTTVYQGLTWPASDCNPCRMVVRSSGWDWKFKDVGTFDFQIGGTSQSVLLDIANNAFVVLSASTLWTNSFYYFYFTGSNFRNPFPYESNANSFTIQTVVNNQYLRTLTLGLPYGSLYTADFSGTASSCSVINSRWTGSNGGNVACLMDIPIVSSIVSNVVAIRVDFPTTSEYSLIHPYCEAYVYSGSTSVPGGQMTCSRIETAANSGSLFLSGFTFSSGSTIRLNFRARLKIASLTTNIYLQVLQNSNYYSVHRQLSYGVDLSGVVGSGYNAPTYFKVQPFSPTPLPINSPGTKSPLRIVTNIESAITANSGYIDVTLGSGFPLNGLALPQCSLRLESTYALPIITRCSWDSSNRIFRLTPVSAISTTGRYLITIGSHQSDLISDGVTFPTDTNRVTAKVYIYSGSTLISYDKIYLANIANAFYGASISPQYNLVGAKSSQFELNFQPSSSATVPADTTSSEVVLALEFPTPLYDYDLGASTVTYAADGIAYYNGIFLPTYGANVVGTDTIATLHYGQTTDNGRVIISKHTGFPTASRTISLGLIKNPANYSPLRVKMQVLQYQNGQSHATVLYEVSYINYYYTLPTAGETGDSTLWYFSNPYAQQATNIILYNKYYNYIDGSSKLYVKLRNQARGFNYAGMTSISCSGYNVQWHKAGYIFYLISTSYSGYYPTITCSGFLLGTTIETVSIETGVHRYGQYIYASSQSITMSVLNPIPSSTNSIVRTSPGLDNRGSVSRYTISLNTNVFVLKAGGYLLFVIPSGLAAVPGLSEYVYVSGLADSPTGSSPTSIQATIVSGNIKVVGYKDFSGQLTFTLFLRNINAGTNQIILNMYDEKGTLVAQSNMQTISVSSSDYSSTGSVTTYLTDAIDVFASEKFRMTFKLGIKNTLSYSSSSRFLVTLPSGFSLLAGYEICKYRLDTSTNWIRSPCTVSSQTITIPLVQGFDVNSGSTVHVRLTTEDAYYTNTGMDRPSTTNVLYTFNVKTQNPVAGASYVESVYIPFVLYPDPDNLAFTAIWYSQGAGDQSVIEVRFITPVDLGATEFYQLDLYTNDEIGAVFPTDLGTGSLEKRVQGNCAEHPSYNSISNNIQIGCYIQQGRYTSAYPARLIVRNEMYIDTWYTNVIRFYGAKITNPGAMPGGFVISVMTPCRNDGYGCPRYRLRAYRDFTSYSPKTSYTAANRATPESSLDDLLDDNSYTTFTFNLDNPVTSSDAIIVRTNTVNIVIGNDCSTSGSNLCIHFPRIGWTFYQPSGTISAGTTASIAFRIDNADYFDRTNPYDLFIEPWSTRLIQQIVKSYHPAYILKIPALAYWPTQTDFNNPYIVRNFDNIIRISLMNIWRTARVRKIIVLTPSSYLTLPSYCMAGIDLANVGSTNYIELPCQVTGDREITIVINDPTRWTAYYATQPVYVYFRGFLPVDYTTGLTTTSNITSYCDLTQPYVLDENTNFQFTISPTPTPIIRDVNLNLKSVNDRISRINDYVMFYAAIWPNTVYGSAGPITQMLFEIADDYAYPSLANLICVTKVVFKIQVSCTLKRKAGRTQIYVTPPPDYQHSPFLLTITNSAENLLFIAPNREGSFRFNVTYLDAAGNQVEKAESFMDINGEYVQSFTAEPIRQDASVKTLYDIQFTTNTRVTPESYTRSGQTVYTQIVLLFQTYSPAFPLDLGTGLADGSEMSCIAVSGLTFTVMKKLTCKLVYGLPTDHSLVIITGYDAIPANTLVRIFIDDIITMAAGVTSRIKLEIRSTYADTGETFVFYNSLVVSPLYPSATSANVHNNLGVTRKSLASAVLRERTSYTVTFYIYAYNSLTAGDYIIFDFPSYGYELESDYSNVAVVFTSGSYPCKAWVMPKTNRVYIQIQSGVVPYGAWSTFDLINIQNPSFLMTGTPTFQIRSVVSKKMRDSITQSITFTSTVCTLFSNEQILYNSSYIKMNENTYQISFSVDHAVPAAGSLAIVFDSTKYNLRPSSPTCELVSGFGSLATCEFELFIQPLVRIKMNGQAMSAGTSVKVNIVNVNNPTDNSAAPTITLQSYFDSTTGTTNTICSKAITLSAFKTLASIKCPITIQPEANNVDTNTDYIITLSCSGDIRNATVIDVQFPPEFANSFSSDLSCSTNGNYMIDQCSLIARTTRVNILVTKPSSQEDLIVRIRDVKNPASPGTYTTSTVNLLQYSVNYGIIDSSLSSTSITLVSNANLVKSDSKLTLSIFPKNYGEKATYFFYLPGINVKQVPTELILDFDTAYSRILGSSLECGTFTPSDTYGKSYALNYENLTDYKGFTCAMADDYKLKFTLSPTFTIEANKTYNLFFYVQGIINPSINSQTSYSFNFILTASGSAVFSSQNTITIAFGLPPSLLQIKSLTSSDSNILAPATYTFTLQATAALPASTSNSVKDYELEMILPSTLYPDFQQSVQMVYSFPDTPSIQSGSSAFNYQNALFFSATYPNLQTLGTFRLTLGNITNPSVESYCGLNAAGEPVTFETQYVSRKQGYVYGRTYPIADQQNCLSLGKTRDAIKVISPLYLRRGLIYTMTLQVEEAASDLYLTPISTFLTFEPKTVSFLNYQARTVSLKVVVPRNVPMGEYLIQWKKREGGSHVNYLEVPDTRVIVVDETTSTSITPIPKVRVELIKYVWTGKSARDVLVALDIAPAEELIVQIKSKTVDTKLKGSIDGITYSQFPISLTFSKDEANKKFYVTVSDGAKDNVLTYTVSGANAKAYDSKIADTPFSVQTQLETTGFQILSVNQVQVLENTASYLITLSSVGTVYYIVVIENSITPTKDQIVSGSLTGVDSQFYTAGSVVIQKIEYASTYSSYVNLTALGAQTKYQIHFVARSVFGEYSEVNTYTFKTLKVSEGAILLIPSLKNITSSNLLEALSIILPISKSRLIFNGAEEFPIPDLTKSDQALGSQLNGYRVTIAPDPNNNSPSPLEIANELQTQTKQDQLLALVPEFYEKAGVRVTPVKRIAPRVIVTPSVSQVGYYDMTVHAELIEVGKLYVIVTEKTDEGNTKPTSLQISKGLMASNKKLNDRYVKTVTTTVNGDGDVVFDELRDNTQYNVYITAGNDVPYDPVDILDNSEVVHLQVQTLKNPNVGSSDEAQSLYDAYYKSANRISGLFWGTIMMMMITILYI